MPPAPKDALNGRAAQVQGNQADAGKNGAAGKNGRKRGREREDDRSPAPPASPATMTAPEKRAEAPVVVEPPAEPTPAPPAPPRPRPGLIDTEPCPACSHPKGILLFRSGDRLYGTTDREFTIVECESCRLIRIEPQPDPGELAGYYPPSYWFAPGENAAERLEEAYRRMVLADHVRFVRRAYENSGEEGPILDVGCGGGLFLRLMAENGIPVIGHEISLEAARVATHVNGVPALCGKLPRCPLPDASCAVVTMFHLLEHLYDPASYVEAAHRLLKPEGRLVLQVPNAASWQALLFGARWNGYDVPRHLYDFKPKDIELLLDACGFEPVRWKYFSLRDNPAGLATTIAPSLDPMARRIRRVKETSKSRLFRNFIYLGLVLASVPFTVVEAICRAGSTVMVEARKKS